MTLLPFCFGQNTIQHSRALLCPYGIAWTLRALSALAVSIAEGSPLPTWGSVDTPCRGHPSTGHPSSIASARSPQPRTPCPPCRTLQLWWW
eukprot:933857-Pelagomonas_calceolata.AAC.1